MKAGAHSERPASRRISVFGSGGRMPDPVLAVLVGLITLSVSFVLLDRLGFKFFIIALGGALVVALLGFVTFKNISFALTIWMFSMAGFRTVGMVSMPGLPDMSFDRLLLVWMIMFFLFRVVTGAQKLKGPYTADAVLLLTTVYIVVQIQFKNSPHFHFWVLSYLSPLFGFIYGKFAVKKDIEIRNILVFFFILTIYFYFTAIAEHFSWNGLIFPRSILDPNQGFWIQGRARGPLLHPPLFGQVLAMIMLVQFYLLARSSSGVRSVALGVSLGLSLLGLLFAYTRGPWVAAAVGILALGALRPGFRKIVVVMIVIGFLGTLVGAMQLANSEFLKERLENTHTIENRLGFFANAFRMFGTDPLFGVGFFNFQSIVGDFNQATHIPFYGLVRKGVAANVPIHDIYVGRLCEEGIVGSFLQFFFYWLILKAFLDKWRRNVWSRWFNRDTMALFAGIMITYLVGGLIIDYRYFDLVNVIFYLLAGIIYGFDPLAAGSQSSMSSISESRSGGR